MNVVGPYGKFVVGSGTSVVVYGTVAVDCGMDAFDDDNGDVLCDSSAALDDTIVVAYDNRIVRYGNRVVAYVNVHAPLTEVHAMKAAVGAFVTALRAYRVEHLWTQKRAGEVFAVSRDRYLKLELGVMPNRYLQPHYAHVLYGLSPLLAKLFAAAVGRPLEQLIVQVEPWPALVAPAVARAAVEAAVYKAAEAHELAPAVARRVVADVLEPLVAAGLSLQQVAEHVRAAVNERASGNGPASKRAK